MKNKQKIMRRMTYSKIFWAFMIITMGVLLGGVITSYEVGDVVDNNILWSRTASSETWKNLDTGEMTITLGKAFVDKGDKPYPNYVPLGEYLTYSEDEGGINWTTYDGKVLRFEYTKANKTEFDALLAEKIRCLDIKATGCSMSLDDDITDSQSIPESNTSIQNNNESIYYNISNNASTSENFIIKFVSDDSFVLNNITNQVEWNGIIFDFNEPITNQGLDVDFYNITNQIAISGENISLIDPTVVLQTAGSENLKDAHVEQDNGNTNYGASSMMKTSSWPTSKYRIYISFNTSIIDYAQKVIYANLSLYYLSSTQGAVNKHIDIYNLYNDWVNGTGNNILNETQLTWNNQPCGINLNNDTNCNTTILDSQDLFTVGTWITFNVTSSLSNTKNNISFVLNQTTNYQSNFSSKEYTTDSTKIPKLTITYTPYINILSPTPSQIFTQDAPTTIFNISTAVAMDVCYWNENNVNYTLTANASKTGFTLTNTTMVDGAHTISYWCNQSSDGTWRQSESINFEVDSVNITKCRGLYTSREYELINNITTNFSMETDDFCIDLNDGNRIIDGNGYFINNIGGYAGYAISSNEDNITIKNINIFGAGISTSANSIYYNIYITNASNPIVVEGFSNNLTIRDIKIENPQDGSFEEKDIVINEGWGSQSLFLINATYASEFVAEDGGILTRKWYFNSKVNTSIGNLENANITIYNSTNSIVYSALTDSNGNIPQQEIIEYINNGDTITYQTPHNITISKINYITNSTIINFSSTTNYNHYVTLELEGLTITITSPLNNSYLSDNTSIPLTFTTTNTTSLSTCLYTFDNYMINTTLTNCQSTTFSKPEGNYLLTIWVNDSLGSVGNKSSNFTIDLTYPQIIITSPINASSFNNQTQKINYTVSDTSLSNCWWTGNGSTNPITCGINITFTASEGWNNIIVYANDSAGNTNSSRVSLFVDSLPPQVSYGSRTEANNAYKNQNYVYINLSVVEASLANVTFRLSGSSDYFTTSPVYNYNFTSLTDRTYYYNTTVCDTTGNCNTTTTRNITLDTIYPTLNITYPINGVIYTISSFVLNYTRNDTNLNSTSCKYSKNNGVTNTTLTNCVNGTSISANEGSNTWYLYITDIAGNFNTTSVTFIVDTHDPNTTITNPTNINGGGSGTNRVSNNSNVTFTINFTDIGSGLNNGTLNITNSTGDIVNQTSWSFGGLFESVVGIVVNLMDGFYSFVVNAYDLAGKFVLGVYNLFVDTTPPVINITSPIGNQGVLTSGTYNVSLNYTINDLNVSSCWYSLNNAANVSLVNCSNKTLTNLNSNVTSNTLTLYSNDTLNNLNSATTTFYHILQNSISYNNTIYETESTNLSLNYTSIGNLVSAFGLLHYDGKDYLSTSTCNNGSCRVSNTIDVPLLSGSVAQNKSFFWTITVYDGRTAYVFNTTSYNQTVLPLTLFSNTSCANKVLNFTAYDEQNRTKFQIFDFDGDFNYYMGSGATMKNFSIAGRNVNEIIICLNQSVTAYIDAIIAYAVPNVTSQGYTTTTSTGTNSPVNQTTVINSSGYTTVIINQGGLCNTTTTSQTTGNSTESITNSSSTSSPCYSNSTTSANPSSQTSTTVTSSGTSVGTSVSTLVPGLEYPLRNWFYQKYPINNITKNVSLYLLKKEDSTNFIFQVQDRYLLPVKSYLVEPQRCYQGLNSIETVFKSRTDQGGQTTGNLEANTALYQFLITNYSQTILAVTPCSKIVPNTPPYTLTFQLGEDYVSSFYNIDNVDGLNKSLVYNNTNNVLTLTYTDTSGNLSRAQLVVKQLNYTGNNQQTICDESNYLQSGIITCNLTESGSYTAAAYIYRSPANLIEQIVFTVQILTSGFGYYGVFLGIFIILISAFAFKFNELAGIILINVAIIFCSIVGLINFGIVFITSMICVSILIIAILER